MQENPSIYLQQNIRFLRKRRNWSQGELAKQVGLNRGNIASYEKGIAEPKLSNLMKIARLFNVTLCDITERDLQHAKESTLNGHRGLNGKAILLQTDENALEHYLDQAEELQTVASSLYNCHCFKLKNIEVKDKTTQALVSNFEQLYEVTHDLIHSHQELLDLVKEQNKSVHAHLTA